MLTLDQFQITIDYSDDMFTLTVTHDKTLVGKITTSDMSLLMTFAGVYQYGQFATRQKFEEQIIRLLVPQENIFELASHLN